MASKNPAVEVAREVKSRGDNVVTLCTGVRARLQGVASALINEARMRIPDPPVPIILREDGSQEENPWHPEYKLALEEAENRRNMASMDATIMFGIILLDDINQDESWLNNIRWMARHNTIDISEYDLEDELDREFLYKKYIAVTNKEVMEVMALSGVSQEAVAEQIDSFPGDGKRRTASRGDTKA